MRKKDIRHIFLAAAVSFLSTAAVYAAEPHVCSITVDQGDEISDNKERRTIFYCIKVASFAKGGYELKDEYKASGADLRDTDTAIGLREAAEKLAGCDHKEFIRKTADDAGKVKFEGLDSGVYLIKAACDAGRDMIAPSLISVPATRGNGEDMCFDVTMKPKHSLVKEEKSASPAKTGADSREGYCYLALAGGALALFCGIISAYAAKKKKVLDNHKPYGKINR